MVYIIIFIIVAAVLGPLLSVLPSKHQRAVASFRDRARQAGILVQLREPKNIPARLQRASDESLVCYSQRLKPAMRGAEPELWVRSRVGWESRSGNPTPSVIMKVTEHVEVIFVSGEDVQVFWDERGGDAAYSDVEKLIKSGVEDGFSEGREGI